MKEGMTVAKKKSENDTSASDKSVASAEPIKSKPRPVIECPAELSPVAHQEWDRIVPILAAADRLTELDRGLLAVYCHAYAAWLEAVTALQTYGRMMKSPNGYPILSPYVSIESKNAEIMLRVAAEFGFTPASRMRLPYQSKNPFLLELRSVEEIASELKPLE
jgi:P27 family predicted phage terminase small subunit